MVLFTVNLFTIILCYQLYLNTKVTDILHLIHYKYDFNSINVCNEYIHRNLCYSIRRNITLFSEH